MAEREMIGMEIVFPCFNESGNLPRLLSELITLADEFEMQFVIVDNGSTDKTWDILSEVNHPKIKTLRLEENRGYGGGILEGLRQCESELVGWMHADLQTPPSVLRAIEIHNVNRVFVKGLRQKRGVIDRTFTTGMSLFETALFRQVLWDINAQPTLFPRSWFNSLKSAPSDFSLDLFVYLHAKRSKLKVVRIPVDFGKRESGTSSWNDGLRSRVKFSTRIASYSFKLWRACK